MRRYGSPAFCAPISAAYSGELLLVARDRVRQLGQDGDERARDADELGETAHLGAVVPERELSGPVERRGDRVRPGGGIAVLVAADPRPEAERRGDAGQPAPQLARQLGRLLEQALLEEPEPMANLVDDAWPERAHLVGLPEGGHLLGDRVADPVAPGGREIGVVELAEQEAEPEVGSQDRSASRLGGVSGEHELERDAGGGAGEALVVDPGGCELGEGRVERLAQRLPLVLVLAPAAEPMVLLGEIGELEVEAEGTEHVALAHERELADGGGEIGARPGPSRPAGLT